MRNILVLILAGICIFTLSVSFAETRGDMDCDGSVGIAEAIIALQVVSGNQLVVDLSTPCVTSDPSSIEYTPIGYIEWNGLTVDYRGSVNACIPGCTQNETGIFWNYEKCVEICNRIGPGGTNCRSMCSNIKTVTNNNLTEVCTQTATIIDPFPDNVELGRLELSDDGEVVAVGTVTSSIQGCRQDNSGVYWGIDPCLDDCARLAAGGLNCRKTCYFMRDDPARNDIAYCTY